jgi:hypothetical protein
VSAFMVSNATLDVIVQGATKREYGSPFAYYYAGAWHIPAEDPSAFGRLLAAQNVTSLVARYGPDEAEHYEAPRSYRYRAPRNPEPLPGVLAKALACYEYQSCEDAGWETSEAHAAVMALAHGLLSRLAGYEAAEWDNSDEKVHGKAAAA